MPATPEDFDRYVAERNIPEEQRPEAFADWIAEHTAGLRPASRRSSPVTSRSSRIGRSAS